MKGVRSRDRAVLRGERKRSEILKTSVDVASAEGLQGITIGRLAEELQMSKSGLFAHFGSKEELQLATIDAARRDFVAQVIDPTLDEEPGLVKLVALMDTWMKSVEKGHYRGGCFFFAASAEMDDRPGDVRTYLAKLTADWVRMIQKEAGLAVRLGELRQECDVALLAFQLHGFVQEANWFRRLHDDKKAFDRARASVFQVLEMNATKTGMQILADKKGRP